MKIEITANLTKVNILDVTYRPYEKPNYNLKYINTSSNYPPQIIKHLTQTISERLSRNFSSAEMFEQSKPNNEEALNKTKQNCCCYKTKLKYVQPNLQQNNTRKRTRKIICFNPHFSLDL